jgi:hypothetical protein
VRSFIRKHFGKAPDLRNPDGQQRKAAIDAAQDKKNAA